MTKTIDSKREQIAREKRRAHAYQTRLNRISAYKAEWQRLPRTAQGRFSHNVETFAHYREHGLCDAQGIPSTRTRKP